MRCPKCGCQDDKVIDSRASREGATIRRRRQCVGCGYRFTTYEEIERGGLVVIKRDGRREEFSKDKLIAGIKKACQKRPVSPKVIEDLVEGLVNEVTDKHEREVPGEVIGRLVMEGLRQIDEVAYVRFASVYRRFPPFTGSQRFCAGSKKTWRKTMIALSSDCLLFQFSGGESVPFSAEMISIELMGETARWLDPEMVRQAAKAVFHYFKYELNRKSVSVEDFASSLEKVLRGFQLENQQPAAPVPPRLLESDLCQLARDTGEARELVFFPRLRQELRQQLRQQPTVLRFRGLRGCVKHLV